MSLENGTKLSFSVLDGKSVLIEQLHLVCDIDLNLEHVTNLDMIVTVSDKTYNARFSNVSSFRINCVESPIQIDGLAIIDNNDRGFENESRYRVYDYEDGLVSFYCEEIIIQKIN